MNEILLSIFGVLIGSLVTLIAARIYYEKAGNDLKFESDQLKQLNELMLRAMEQAGLAEFTRDNTGKIIDLRLVLRVSDIQINSHIDNIVLTPSNRT